MLIEATTGFRPNGVEFVLVGVRKYSAELSNTCDFSMYHHQPGSNGFVSRGACYRSKSQTSKTSAFFSYSSKNVKKLRAIWASSIDLAYNPRLGIGAILPFELTYSHLD